MLAILSLVSECFRFLESEAVSVLLMLSRRADDFFLSEEPFCPRSGDDGGDEGADECPSFSPSASPPSPFGFALANRAFCLSKCSCTICSYEMPLCSARFFN